MMSQHKISPEQIEKEQIYNEMGLTDEEYQLAKDLLKRRPNYTETGILSAIATNHRNHYLKGSQRKEAMFYKDLVKVLGLLILAIIKQLFLKLKVIIVRLLSSHLKVQQQV